MVDIWLAVGGQEATLATDCFLVDCLKFGDCPIWGAGSRSSRPCSKHLDFLTSLISRSAHPKTPMASAPSRANPLQQPMERGV